MKLKNGIRLASSVALAVVACSSSSSSTDAPPAEPTCPGDLASSRFPSGNDGHADPFGAKAARQARAGRIKDAASIVQPANGRNKVRIGDFAIANEKIAAYIEAEGESGGYDIYGGKIVGIEPVGEDGKPRGLSEYGETLFGLSRQTVSAETVSVIADGSDGNAAIVRVSGVLKNIPFMDTFRALQPQEYGFPVAIDYVLEPGAEKLTIRLSVTNTGVSPPDLLGLQNIGFFHSHRSQPFTEERGFDQPRDSTAFVAFDGNTSAFAVRALGSKLTVGLSIAGFDLWNASGLALEACASKTVDYAEIIPGAPGIDGLLEVKRRVFGEPAWREVKGTVKEASGKALAHAMVHATALDGHYLTRATADADGAFVLHVPKGAVKLTPIVKGYELPAVPTQIGDADTNVPLTLATRATLAITIKDAQSGEGLPARVQVIPLDGVMPAPASFGVQDDEINGRLYQAFSTSGTLELAVPEGQHRIIVTRGYEYEIFETTVSAESGKTMSVAATLLHSVKSPTVMCADFHIHSNLSADSTDLIDEKVKAAIADGLEIPVSSEHEWILDFQPVIERLGLRKWAYGFPSEELTTFTFGHFGVVPIFPRPGTTNNGAVGWVGKSPAAIFKQVNELPEKPMLIVNHPSGANPFASYFSAASFDRQKATGSPDLWSDDFSAVEVFNDSDFESNRGASVADWFALLDAGRSYWAVGNSDSHRQKVQPVGYPRTCLQLGHDDPQKLSAEIVRDVLRTGAATISAGLLMSVVGPGGIGPGGTSQAGAYKVSVSSPSWIEASKLEVIVDGDTTQMLDLVARADAGTAPAHQYEATVNIAANKSRPRHWVVFHAKGPADKDLGPLHPKRRPFAVSNPIFF